MKDIPIPKSISERLLELEIDGSDEFPLDKFEAQSVRNAASQIRKTRGRTFVTRVMRDGQEPIIRVWRTS